MSRTDDENAYTGTPGREDQGEDRVHRFEGFPDPPHGGAPTQNPRRGGWNDPEAVQAVFLDMQRRMDEMEQQLRDQGKTQQDQNAQIPQHQPATATSGVDPTVRPPPVILPPTRLPVHSQIPEFTGEMIGPTGVMSIEVYLKRIDDNTTGRHWTDEHRIILARKYLSGNALTRLNNRGMYDAENWGNFKKQIRETFTVREEVRESAWYNYQPIRKNGESVSALVDRIGNDLDSFTENGTMPEKQKLKEVKRVLVRVLPPQLHYGIDSSVDTLQKLMQELELRACRQPDLKLAPPDISNEITESWKNSTQNSTINAVSTATTAPPAAATATASADPATVNPTPPPQPTVAATASNTKTKDEDNEPTPRVKENSYRSKKGDKRKPQRGQRQQQHQRQYQQQQQQRGRGNDNRIGPCHTCGRLGHRRQECHYSGLSCHNCGRPGHLASVCRQWQQKKTPTQPPPQQGQYPFSPTDVSRIVAALQYIPNTNPGNSSVGTMPAGHQLQLPAPPGSAYPPAWTPR